MGVGGGSLSYWPSDGERWLSPALCLPSAETHVNLTCVYNDFENSLPFLLEKKDSGLPSENRSQRN